MARYSNDDMILMSPKTCIQCGKTQSILAWLINKFAGQAYKLPPGWHTVSEQTWSYHPDLSNWSVYSKKLSTSNCYRNYLCEACWNTSLQKERQGSSEQAQRRETESARKKAEYEIWLQTEEAKRILENATRNEQDQRIFDWLKKYEGKTMEIRYENTGGDYLNNSGTQTLSPPVINRERKCVYWSFTCSNLELPTRAFGVITESEKRLAVKLGYIYYYHNDEIAGQFPAGNDGKVDFWVTHTFELLD